MADWTIARRFVCLGWGPRSGRFPIAKCLTARPRPSASLTLYARRACLDMDFQATLVRNQSISACRPGLQSPSDQTEILRARDGGRQRAQLATDPATLIHGPRLRRNSDGQGRGCDGSRGGHSDSVTGSLGREPEPEGLLHHMAVLERTGDLTRIMDALANSEEATHRQTMSYAIAAYA